MNKVPDPARSTTGTLTFYIVARGAIDNIPNSLSIESRLHHCEFPNLL